MKKIINIVGFLVIICHFSFSQELSLEEALTKSKHQTSIQADKQLEVEAIKLKIQQSKRIPLIYGEANLQRNLIVPTTPVPAIAFNPNAAPGDIMPLRFATDWSAKAGLQLSFDIFNPELEGSIKLAKLSQQKAALQQQDAYLNEKNVIRDLYAQVVLAQSQLQVAQKVTADHMTTLKILKERHDAGRLDEIQWNNALQKGMELEQLEEEAAMVLLNKKIALLPYIDLDLNTAFTTPLDQIIRNATSTNSNLDKETLLVDKELNNLKIKNLNNAAIPKLTLNGYLGTQYFNNELRLLNADYWFGISYINLALRLPITEVFERNLNKKQLLVETAILDSKLQLTKSDDEVLELQKKNDLLVLKQKVERQEQIVSLATSNVEIIKTQVEEGTKLVADLNKEIEALINQQKKLWQTQYDLLKKTID